MHNFFWYSLTTYYIFSFVIVVISLIVQKKSYRVNKLLVGTAFVLFIPCIGILYYLFMVAFKPLKQKKTIEDFGRIMDDKVFEGTYLLKSRATHSKNIVPIEEALILNDNKTKREILLSALKHDSFAYVDQLKIALKDKDTETSHYAAAALMEIKRKLTLNIQQFSYNYENNKDDISLAIAYSDVLKKYLESGMLDERNQRKYMYTYVHVLADINKLAPQKLHYFKERINILISLKEYEMADLACEQFLMEHPSEEEPYLRYLKLYYVMRDCDKFEKMLNKIKTSNIALSHNGLNKVRFWINEGA